MTRAAAPSRQLARGSAIALVLYGASAGLAYCTQLAIARIAGVDGYGVYAYVFATLTVLAYFAALGCDVSLLRFVPAYRAQQAPGLAQGVIRYAECLAALAGIGVALLGTAAVVILGGRLRPGLADTFLVGFALVPVWALLWVRSSVARAFGAVASALAPERIVRDGLLLGALLLAGPGLGWRIGAPAAMGATLIGSVASLALVSLAAGRLRSRALAGVAPVYAARTWLRAAAPLVLIGTVEPLMNRTGVMLLGALGHVQAAGIYAAAFNVAFLAVLPRTAVNAMFAPAAADLFARDDRAGLQALIARTGTWTLLGAVGIALPLWVLAGPVLAWFGPGFAAGAGALRILLLGQVAAAAAGSQLPLMTMTGHERGAALLLAVSTAAGLLVGVALIGPLGLVGAAVATTMALVVWNAAMALFIWRHLRLLPGLMAAIRRPAVAYGRVAGSLARLLPCTSLLLATALLLATGLSALPTDDKVTGARVAAALAMPEPPYRQPVTDPVFGTPFVRVTDPGGARVPGLPCGPRYCTHRYSSAQAWNADQSLLVIVNGCHGFCFLDGHSFQPLFVRRSKDECEWHPADAARMICVSARRFYAWQPRTDAHATIDALPGYRNFQLGPYKGNLSRDGARLVLRATDRTGALVAFAYDIPTHTKFPDIALAKLQGDNGFCGISPSGRYVFCFQEMPDATNEAYVLTLDGRQVQHWTENHRPGHGDMTIDADGEDVYVGISKADPDRYHIIKRRLRDGAVTDLAPFGEGVHASIRNINRPGWVFVTYAGNHREIADHPDWAPFYDEVVALRTDGSGRFRRIVQTRDAKSDYWSEAHASPSPDGSQVIWSSNWGRAGDPVADYVAQLSWPEKGAAGTAQR